MNENSVIAGFAEIHRLKTHCADAERFGGMLFSMDSFSETEDFFTRTPPEIIGHDIAVGACSDLLACGVLPQMLLQSWNLDESRDMEYYRKIAEGVESVLSHYGAKCIGGDTGSARPWCWTAAVASQTGGDPVTRIAKERISFDLYLSHPMGEANLAMFSGKPMIQFSLNDPVPSDALFATDSSGGFFDALENFRRVNTGMCLFFDPRKACSAALSDLPEPLWGLIGGVGEYELVYGVPHGNGAPGIKIGEGDFTERSDNLFEWEHGRMKNPPPDYRDIAPENRVGAVKNYLREMTAK